jgi:putative ABC transport system substrate-binding protein
MRRREFITLLGGAAAAWPLAARAQQPGRMPRIVVLEGYDQNEAPGQARVAAFAQGLQELGWLDGRNITIEYRFTSAEPDRMRANATALSENAPALIVATSTPITQSLLQTSVPIVFVNVSDPIGSGLVTSLARPSGRITGFTNYESSVIGKWLELLKEVAPRLAKVAVMSNAQNPASIMFFRSIEAMATTIGVQSTPVGVVDAASIQRALDSLAHDPGTGLIVLPEPVNGNNRDLIISLAAQHRLPTVYPFSFYPAAGGLMSYGVDPADLYRRAATYVDRILKGAKPGDLPVQQPTKFELVINLKTAKAIGLTIPESLLLRADELIE